MMWITIILVTLSATYGQDLTISPSFPFSSVSLLPGFVPTGFNSPVASPSLASGLLTVTPSLPEELAPAFQQETVAEPTLQSSDSKSNAVGIPAYVSLFAKDFSDIVTSTDELRNVFNLKLLPPLQVKGVYFNSVLGNLASIGSTDAGSVANLVSQSVDLVADTINPSLYATVTANVLGKLLAAKGFLTAFNIHEVAQNYASSVQNHLKAAIAIGVLKPEIQAFVRGFIDFATSFGIRFPDYDFQLAIDFADQLKKVKDSISSQQYKDGKKI